MSKVWYGSIQNRIEENNQFIDEIKVGDGVTEYLWSDRRPYEVVKVVDQKHISIRELDHELAGDVYSNEWELKSNEDNDVYDIVKRGKYWYKISVCDLEMLKKAEAEWDNGDFLKLLSICNHGFDTEKIREKGKQTKYHRMNISIGHAEYYYDYEF